ncbi:MAG: hypothetical protein HGB00_10310, partial [Chlorobiaceae bacterium]|nr:hypothetical protein [Chlorobiaceae bacterium]
LSGASRASTLTLSSTGALSNAASSNILVTGLSSLSAASINLGNAAGDAFNTGSLTFNSPGDVNISENSDTTLAGVNMASTLVLSASGLLTNAASSRIGVTGQSTLSGTSINLGNAAGDDFRTGTLRVNSTGNVNVSEDGDTMLTGASGAYALTLSSTGALSNAASSSIAVTGLGTLSGASINVGNASSDSFNTGTLRFTSPGSVSISEDSSTMLAGVNKAQSLTLVSSGALSNAPSSTITVTGLSTLSGSSINVGNAAGDAFNTGKLGFVGGGSVSISENSATVLSATSLSGGQSSAGSLTLVSTGSITNDATMHLDVAGRTSLKGTLIRLGNVSGDYFKTGSLVYSSPVPVVIVRD